MPVFDLILIGIIICFALFGLWFGLISAAGSLVGTAAGVFLSSRIYEWPAFFLGKITGWSGNFPRVVAFLFIFLVVNRLVGLAFSLIDRIFYFFTSLPVVGVLNRLLGTIFGLFEGILVVGIFFYFTDRYNLPWQSFNTAAANSQIATLCVGISSFLWPLLPEALRYFKKI